MKKTKSMRYYYGNLHAHTNFSTGQGTPYYDYSYSKRNHLDFLAVTDLNSYLISYSRWQNTLKMMERFKKNYSDFAPLNGFEVKSVFGDLSIINCDKFFTGDIKNINLLVLWMINNKNAIVTIVSPTEKILSINYSKPLDNIITSYEVCTGIYPKKYFRNEKYYYKLLDKGFKLGAINGQDNHIINFGSSENTTCIISESLRTECVIDALRNRRCYSTESRTLRFYFRIDDCFMGGIFTPVKKSINFEIFAQDIRLDIVTIEIVSSNNTIVKRITNINLKSVKYMYRHEREEFEKWFVVRIYQKNNRVAISSPVFISD